MAEGSLLEKETSDESSKVVLTILHFNDVYEIEAREEEPVGGAARFATALKQFHPKNPLIVFSGDCLNPSLLSTITKGKHMVEIFKKLGVHCAVYGNHEFDFGVDLLEEMAPKMNLPWFLSNVYDRFTSQPLGHGMVSSVFNWDGLKIGIMGLVEEEWLDTLGTVNKSNIDYVDYVVMAERLSKELREKGAELIVAITHMKWSNDIRLASKTKAVDLILGGHDHEYGILEENGILVVKSGSDFRYLSKIDVVRNCDLTFSYAVQKIAIEKNIEEDPAIKCIVMEYSMNIQYLLEEVLCQTERDLDGRFTTVRKSESNLGNLITNAMLEATHADVALLNSGTLRSDRIHPAGPFTMHDLMQILPITDPVLVVEATGQQLLEALENGVRNYPELDGRFPQVAGIEFGFDPNAEPGHRIVFETVNVQGQNLEKSKTYLTAIKEYLAKGKDGYAVFLNCRWMFDIENAQILSTILINHFESAKIVQGLKICKSGHRMGLIRASSTPSVTAFEEITNEEMSVAFVPGVEGRIYHVSNNLGSTS
nr:PREDICTED: trifunctional nucleotide phosphoesterase protein YfkN-like isoform X2 [Lepisosteus oculatus]